MKTTIILLLLLAVPLVSRNEITPIAREIPMMKLTTEERIVAVLKDAKLPREMQRIILAQAKHESGEFTNSLTVKNNNIFAMMHPKRRPTTSIGPYGYAEHRRGYASYTSIEQAVTDYIIYRRYARIEDSPTAESYIRQLKKKKYFTDGLKTYLGGVVYFMKADTTVRNFSNNQPL